MGLYLFCVLYSRLNELDGFIPLEAALRGWSGNLGENRARLKTLCSHRVGYLRRVDHGYEIEKYSDFNETKAEIKVRRESSNERKKKHRLKVERVPNASVTVSDSVSVSDLRSPEGVQREPDTPIAAFVEAASEPEPETSRDRYIRAYCAGIAAGKGGPFAWSGNEWDLGDLGQLIAVFAHEIKTKKPLRGEKLLMFIEDAAKDFATWINQQKDPKTVQFYSAYRPKGCLRFLNEQERAEEARAVG